MRTPTAVFLDRDGVIIEDREDFVKSREEIVYIPAAFTAIRRLCVAGIPVFVATNQSAVGRGIITAQFVAEVHAQIEQELAKHGGRLEGIYCCPHAPDDGCDCRKPLPGLLLQAAGEHGIDIEGSVMIGDSIRDLAAGFAAGAAGILVLTGKGRAQQEQLPDLERRTGRAALVAADIGEAADQILGPERG